MFVRCPCHIAVLGYSRSLDAQCAEEYCNVNVSALYAQKEYPEGVRSEKFQAGVAAAHFNYADSSIAQYVCTRYVENACKIIALWATCSVKAKNTKTAC